MTGYFLSPAAKADIEQIWDYTVERWGEEQAERYVLAIRDACQELAEGARQSRAADDIREGYRKTGECQYSCRPAFVTRVALSPSGFWHVRQA